MEIYSSQKRGGSHPLSPSELNSGSGAADWAIARYGNTDSQTSIPGSNVIQITPPSDNVLTGGRRRRRRRSMNRSKNMKRGGRNDMDGGRDHMRRGGGDMDEGNMVDEGAMESEGAMGGEGVMEGGTGCNAVNGGRKSGGRGVFTNVAVPALLLYANNTFRRRKTMTKSRKSKKNKKSTKTKKSRRGKR